MDDVKAVAEMVAAVDVVETTDVTVKSVTNVTRSAISLANARKTPIAAIVAMALVTLLVTAASRRTSRLAIHATEPVIWPVTVQTLRVVVEIVSAAIAVIVESATIETCLVTLVTRAVTFHATVQMAPSLATTVATRDISVVNVPRMVAEIKRRKTFINASINHFS